ncbi:hypothetical protein D3C73_1043900 [compost metagenome]
MPIGVVQRCRRHAPPSLFLFGLSAQHVDQGARGQSGAVGRGLPLHGRLDGPRHGRPDADGWRRRRLDRPVALHQDAAHLPEHGRRHLLPLGLSGDPPGGGRARQHHLQDPVQRRGRDDGRAARGRPHLRAPDLPAAARRERGAHRGHHRRARKISGRGPGPRHQGPPPARAGRASARVARNPRCDRADP